jgi:hypothetical protein
VVAFDTNRHGNVLRGEGGGRGGREGDAAEGPGTRDYSHSVDAWPGIADTCSRTC